MCYDHGYENGFTRDQVKWNDRELNRKLKIFSTWSVYIMI